MQKRTCRACGTAYDYPVPKSIATRFYCEQCVVIPVEIRRVLETMRRRIERLSAKVEKLESELASVQERAATGP